MPVLLLSRYTVIVKEKEIKSSSYGRQCLLLQALRPITAMALPYCLANRHTTLICNDALGALETEGKFCKTLHADLLPPQNRASLKH